jgi:chemotaxis protein MotB
MSEDAPKKEESAGAPMWVVTFADLMSLLMCFFVLLLSFSEMDLEKYKQVAGSLKYAFGVQRDLEAKMPPKGTSVVAQEFSPGRPTPTPIAEVRQSTVDDTKQTIDFTDARVDEEAADDIAEDTMEGTASQDEYRQDDVEAEKMLMSGAEAATATDEFNAPDLSEVEREQLQAELEKRTEANAERLLQAFKEEIIAGLIEIETEGSRILIRIKEKASFPSGSATLRADFKPVLVKLGEQLIHVPGSVNVAGHTDDLPISTVRFRSNWDLSAARAVSVVHELLRNKKLPGGRFVAEGHGDARPLVPNNSAANRATNRRVEITIVQDRIAGGSELDEFQGNMDIEEPDALLTPDKISELDKSIGLESDTEQ